MSQQMDDFIETLLKQLEHPSHINADDIPNIELYMDQVTTFMDSHLSVMKRNADDKILTKTMINNYAKNDLLPPPVKKKYSRNHILMMIFIYYFKGFLSISDIQKLLRPLASHHFDDDSELSLKEVYEQITGLEARQSELLKKDISDKYRIAASSFEDAEDKDFLQCFAMISMLSFDVYMKKQIIEKMIDTLLTTPSKEELETLKKAEAKAAKKAETAKKAEQKAAKKSEQKAT